MVWCCLLGFNVSGFSAELISQRELRMCSVQLDPSPQQHTMHHWAAQHQETSEGTSEGLPEGISGWKQVLKEMMLHQRRKCRNNLEGKHRAYMEWYSNPPQGFGNKVMFSNSDGWYLLIGARYKHLMSLYSSSVENKRRNRLKNVHSQTKTGSCFTCWASYQCWKGSCVTKNTHGE